MQEQEPQTPDELGQQQARQAIEDLVPRFGDEPETLQELDNRIFCISQLRDILRDRSLELHARRDELLRGGRVDGMLDGLNEADRAALRERLAEHEGS